MMDRSSGWYNKKKFYTKYQYGNRVLIYQNEQILNNDKKYHRVLWAVKLNLGRDYDIGQVFPVPWSSVIQKYGPVLPYLWPYNIIWCMSRGLIDVALRMAATVSLPMIYLL